MLVILGAIIGGAIGAGAGGVIGAFIGAVVGFHLVGWVGVLLIDLFRPSFENRQPAPQYAPEPERAIDLEPAYVPITPEQDPASSGSSYGALPIEPALEATIESVVTHLELFGYEVIPVDEGNPVGNPMLLASHPSKLSILFSFYNDGDLYTSAILDRTDAEISREELEAISSINSSLGGGLVLTYDDSDIQIIGSLENFTYDRQAFARQLETWDRAESLASELIPQLWFPPDSSAA